MNNSSFFPILALLPAASSSTSLQEIKESIYARFERVKSLQESAKDGDQGDLLALEYHMLDEVLRSLMSETEN